MDDDKIECLCMGCGLVYELDPAEIVTEPVADDPGRQMVTNQCCEACGEALITDDPQAGEQEDPDMQMPV